MNENAKQKSTQNSKSQSYLWVT